MDRSSKLADIKLVSKHYSVNYSYPRRDDGTLAHTIRAVQDRTSVGSEGSAPGLIDDRSDSEVSQEDDYQYHTNTNQLWDSFWQQGPKENVPIPVGIKDGKQYPTLVPNTQHHRGISQDSFDRQAPSWPLPDSPPPPRNRKPAASYSPFPSTRPTSSQRQSMRPQSVVRPELRGQQRASGGVPARPPRPAKLLLTPCIEQAVPVPVAFVSPTMVSPTKTCSPVTSSAGGDSQEHCASPSLDGYPNDAPSLVRRASMVLTRRPSLHALKVRTPRHCKSISNIAIPQPSPQSDMHPELPQEPQSAFDFDDSEDEDESHGKFLFRFHKRGISEPRHTQIATELKAKSKRRDRAGTGPSSPMETATFVSEAAVAARKRQVDVFGRILGRRSR